MCLVEWFQAWRTTKNRNKSFETFLWQKTLYSEFFHARNLAAIRLWTQFRGDRRKGEGNMVWKARVLQLFSLKGQADCLERKYAFLQFMACTRPLDTIDRKIGCVCLRCITTDERDHSMGKGINVEFSVGEWFGLEPLNTMWGVVYVDRSNTKAKRFCNATVWPYHHFYFIRFHRNSMVPEYRLSIEIVK